MKMKAIAMLIACLLLCSCVLPAGLTAHAEDAWICTNCRIWVSGSHCPLCGRQRPAVTANPGEQILHLKIDFERNKFFSTYDVEVLINGQKAFHMPHGELLDSAVPVPLGKCTLLLRNAEDHSEDVSFVMNITEETLFTCTISAHFYGLEVSSVTCSANDGDKRLYANEKGVRNGLEMTLVNVKESRGTSNCRPADGYVFVWCEFELNNPSGGTAFIFPDLGFRTVCDGYTVAPSQHAAAEAPMGFAAYLRSGEKARSMLCYELPVNWRELEITYGGFTGNDQLIYRVTRP